MGSGRQLVDNGKVELVPQSTYETWFNALQRIAGMSNIFLGRSTWEHNGIHCERWEKVYRYSKDRVVNTSSLAQPTRGWLEDNDILYHDTELPPHQYIAFYLWLQNEYEVDVMVIWADMELLNGYLARISVCLTRMARDHGRNIPVIYPYVMDGVGEGMQAKRRNAIIIDHLIPVISAGLYNYSTLSSKITAYHTSVTESSH